jgi:hypothetical protein
MSCFDAPECDGNVGELEPVDKAEALCVALLLLDGHLQSVNQAGLVLLCERVSVVLLCKRVCSGTMAVEQLMAIDGCYMHVD